MNKVDLLEIIKVGVSDDGIIKGVQDKNIKEKIMNICRNNCIPNIIPIYERIELNKLSVVAITIPKGMNKPYYTV